MFSSLEISRELTFKRFNSIVFFVITKPPLITSNYYLYEFDSAEILHERMHRFDTRSFLPSLLTLLASNELGKVHIVL